MHGIRPSTARSRPSRPARRAAMTMLAEYGTLSLERRARARDPDGRRLPDRGAAADTIERQKEQIKQWQYSKARVPPALRAHAARRRRSRRDLPPAGSRRDAAQAGRGRAAGAARRARAARRRSTPPTTASTRATSRRRSCAACSEQGGLSRSRIWRTGRCTSRSRVHTTLQGHRRLQARRLEAGPGDAAGAQHPRELRPQVDGLQQRALHPHALPGDEPRLRRPRLLLRRPVLPAGSRSRGCFQGLREGARRADQLASATTRREAGRSVSVPGRNESVPRTARAVARREIADAIAARPADARATSLERRSRRSTPARPRSRPPTRRAGSCRSRRAAAGCRRSSPGTPASA